MYVLGILEGVQSTPVYSPTLLAQCKFWKSGDYRQRKILMFYYEVGTDDTGRRWDYRLSFHMRGL